MSVGGTYVPAAGDFDGDGRSDIFWYGEWTRRTRSDGRADGRFAGAADQRGTFVPLAGDFDGDGLATSTGTSPALTRSPPTRAAAATSTSPTPATTSCGARPAPAGR
ncbi:MAG: VCBS repeat-containing protein [Acidimicrobiales bacterium]